MAYFIYLTHSFTMINDKNVDMLESEFSRFA